MSRFRRWYEWIASDRELLVTENKRLRDDNKRLLEAKEQFKEIASEVSSVKLEQRRTRGVLEKILEKQKVQRYWTQVYEVQLQAILRRLYIDVSDLPYPSKLNAQRFRLVSQNEEDGMTLALMKSVGETNREFVDIGCGLNGGNSGFLAREFGWSGVMVDADQRKAERASRRYGERVKGITAWVTRENINQLLHTHDINKDLDLFSLDIDGVDYWVWEALERCAPRVVIIEYNALFGANRAVVVPYGQNFDRHSLGWVEEQHAKWGRYYYGASLSAVNKLATRKGYRLVAGEPSGTNAFFLRNDVGPDIPGCEVGKAFHLSERHNTHLQKVGENIYDFVARSNLLLETV